MKETQLSLFGGEIFVLPEGGPQGPAVSAEDDLPAGPYRLGLLYDYGAEAYMPPFSVVAGDGRTVAGHIPSLKIATRIRDLLNQAEERSEES